MDEQNIEIDLAFRDWACSLSGCDGGNPKSSIWISGIEWGYAKSKDQSQEDYDAAIKKYYREELAAEISKGKYIPNDTYDWDEHLKYPFGISTAKLYTAIQSRPVDEYPVIVQGDENPNLFKLNLYPIPFRFAEDGLWIDYELAEHTGLESKETYRTWCFINRFPSIAEEVKVRNPKLIIGIGITYLTDFFACFAGTGGSSNIHVGEIKPASSNNRGPRRYYWSYINDGKTTLAVIPFFSGSYGLNSNYLLQEMGTKLSELCGDLQRTAPPTDATSKRGR